MIGLCAVFFMIYTDPESPLNPAPPPTMPVLIVLPTSTATQRALPATWTPTVVTVTPSVAPTTGIQATLPLGTTEPTPTRDLSASAPFVLQGAPMAVADGLFRGPATVNGWESQGMCMTCRDARLSGLRSVWAVC